MLDITKVFYKKNGQVYSFNLDVGSSVIVVDKKPDSVVNMKANQLYVYPIASEPNDIDRIRVYETPFNGYMGNNEIVFSVSDNELKE